MSENELYEHLLNLVAEGKLPEDSLNTVFDQYNIPGERDKVTTYGQPKEAQVSWRKTRDEKIENALGLQPFMLYATDLSKIDYNKLAQAAASAGYIDNEVLADIDDKETQNQMIRNGVGKMLNDIATKKTQMDRKYQYDQFRNNNYEVGLHTLNPLSWTGLTKFMDSPDKSQFVWNSLTRNLAPGAYEVASRAMGGDDSITEGDIWGAFAGDQGINAALAPLGSGITRKLAGNGLKTVAKELGGEAMAGAIGGVASELNKDYWTGDDIDYMDLVGAAAQGAGSNAGIKLGGTGMSVIPGLKRVNKLMPGDSFSPEARAGSAVAELPTELNVKNRGNYISDLEAVGLEDGYNTLNEKFWKTKDPVSVAIKNGDEIIDVKNWPTKEQWNNMTPQERGKFIYDHPEMFYTDKDIKKFAPTMKKIENVPTEAARTGWDIVESNSGPEVLTSDLRNADRTREAAIAAVTGATKDDVMNAAVGGNNSHWSEGYRNQKYNEWAGKNPEVAKYVDSKFSTGLGGVNPYDLGRIFAFDATRGDNTEDVSYKSREAEQYVAKNPIRYELWLKDNLADLTLREQELFETYRNNSMKAFQEK